MAREVCIPPILEARLCRVKTGSSPKPFDLFSSDFGFEINFGVAATGHISTRLQPHSSMTSRYSKSTQSTPRSFDGGVTTGSGRGRKPKVVGIDVQPKVGVRIMLGEKARPLPWPTT